MSFTTGEAITKGKQEGWSIESGDPYGLFCGAAGRAWGLAQLNIQANSAPVIGYDDI